MEEEDGIIDDCTVIIAFLDVPASPSVQALITPKKMSKKNGQVIEEKSLRGTLNQVARKASSLLTPQDIMQKVSIRPVKK